MLPNVALAQQKGYVGLEVRNLETAEADALGWEQPRGALIVSILEDSPAVSSGVLAGDIIVSVDGTEMDGIEDFVSAISSKAPGARVGLRLLRKGRERRVTLVLGVRPKSQPLPETCAKFMPNLGRSIEVACPE